MAFLLSRVNSILPTTTPRSLCSPNFRQRRNFLPAPPFISAPPIQRLSASRTLPYPSLPIYTIIADVPSYSSFLPYCLASAVTHWSDKDMELHRRWPEEAELEIGWGSVREIFTSRIYCVPGRIIEAVAGDASTSVEAQEAKHHTHVTSNNASKGNAGGDILTHLLTRWEVSPIITELGHESTKVALDIEFQFANPLYAAMSQVAAGAVAEKMIQAFETRIRDEILAQRNKDEAGS
ncbi:hypothetical protein BT63DRAFT_130313 [Microthyrium microscopicum]|uniref:Coenzyme Q-binding protein COQ10 START domain-containing protein n=1 Tax=Microthyrium microscopicum TaxID=703497 RepID=A0A6A6TSU9_9PEZI|nr:hypothetical protein BT63DRAFT_130313 [Microthyrium microscopicum]